MSDLAAHIVLDVDWAPDPVLAFALDMLEELDLPATVFLTHDTPLLDRLRATRQVEIGIHPNFNDLLMGTAAPGSGASAQQRVSELMRLVPEARSVRSHSLAQTTRLIDLFADAGLTHEANTYLPVRSGMVLRAWRSWDGRLVRVPFYFEDSLQDHMDEGWDVDLHAGRPGLRVLNFHPIRLYLNARAVELPLRFAPGTPSGRDRGDLDAHRRPGAEVGSRWFLEHFVAAHRRRGGTFARIGEIKETRFVFRPGEKQTWFLFPPAEREFIERVFATPEARYEQALRGAGMAGRELVVDLGAGYGQWSRVLARLNRRVVAVEPQARRLAFLRDLSGGAFDVRRGTAEAIPVDDGAADGLWCFGVLQYVDTAACFREIFRVLRPGGAAYVLGKDLGGYLCDWVERRNRTEGYDPRRVAADAMANTLHLEESGTVHPSSVWTDRIVPLAAAEAAAGAAGLRVVAAGPEGAEAERRGGALEYPAHFFAREYRGFPFSYELLLERPDA